MIKSAVPMRVCASVGVCCLFVLGCPAAEAQSIPATTRLNTLPGDIFQIAVDNSGQIYVTGQTFDANFPVTPNALSATLVGGGLYPQGFLVKFDPSGANILYATYLSGLSTQRLAVDNSGFIYILGLHPEQPPADVAFYYPASFPFPISANAAQTQPAFPATYVLVKFSPSGDLVYSTFVGGLVSPESGIYPYPVGSQAGAIAVDANGAAVVCSSTLGSDLPTNRTSFQRSPGGGWDAYIVRVSPDGTAFEAATYLGGANDEFCQDMKTDAAGNIYVFGATKSRFFPVTSGAFQTQPSIGGSLYVTSLDPRLSTLRWSTLLQGSSAYAINLNADGSVLAFGETPPNLYGTDTTGSLTCCTTQSFAAVLSSNGTKLLSSQAFFQTSLFSQGLTADNQGNLYFGAPTAFLSFDTTLNGGSVPEGAWLTRFNAPSLTLTYLGSPPGLGFDKTYTSVIPVAFDFSTGKLLLAGITDGGASDLGGGVLAEADFSTEDLPLVTQARSPVRVLSQVSPGELVEICGLGLGPVTQVQYDPTAAPPTTLAQTSVLFDGTAVPVLSASNTSVLALAPSNLVPGRSTSLVVQQDGVSSAARSVPVMAADPGVFTTSGLSSGQADALNPDGGANSPQNPVLRGANIRLFVTGLGNAGTTLNLVALSATVELEPAPVVAIAPAANRPTGYFQVDVMIPTGVPESDFELIEIAVNGTTSQPGVTIAVR